MSRLTERGRKCFCSSATEKGLSDSPSVGDLVHLHCRGLVLWKPTSPTGLSSHPQFPRRTGFSSRTCCLFCEKTLTRLVPNKKIRFLAHFASRMSKIKVMNTNNITAFLIFSREDNVTVLADDAGWYNDPLGIQEVEQCTGGNTKIYQDRMGKVYDISYVTNNIPSDLRRAVLLILSFMGCDTTSSIFGHGHKALTKDRIPTSVACNTFCNSSSQIADITKVGEKLMLSIFNSKCYDLDNQRYLIYCRKVGSGAVNKKKGIDPAILPPTSNACKHHHKPAAPDCILSPIKCSCKTDNCQSAAHAGRMGCSAQTSVRVINVQAVTVRLDQKQ